MKSAFNASCTAWMRKYPGRRITVLQLGELFNHAFTKSATMEIAISGFKTTGIVPFDRHIIPEDFVDNLIVPLNEEGNSDLPSGEAATSTPLDLSIETSNSISTSFQDIHPLPTLHKKKRKGEKSEIITSSPYKKVLQESLEKIAEKERIKKVVPTPKAGKEKKKDKV